MRTTPKRTTILRDLNDAGLQKRYVEKIAERRGCSVERVEKLRQAELSVRMSKPRKIA